MAPLPVQVLFGIYLGVLTGITPAVVAFVLGFVFKYFTGVTIPGFGVVVLGVAVAGINGGLLALADPSITQAANAPTLLSALIVVLMLTLYAHSKGDTLGATVPRRLTLQGLRERTLSRDVVELVGGFGQARVEVVGEVSDMEGYPPLPDDIRTAIREGEWLLPAALSLSELETKLADELRTEFDLADVSVSLDENARATVAAAPPMAGLSKRVPAGKRAVSIGALVPTGIARGDEVTLAVDGAEVDGTVVSAQSGTPPATETTTTDGGAPPDGEEEPAPARAPTTTGGEGRVTVAVDRADAETLLGADRATCVVRARGTRREFELVSLLRRAGKRFRRVTVAADGPLDGASLADADLRETHGVVVLAVRTPDGWTIAPRGTRELSAGDEVVAVGTSEALSGFAEAVA